MHRRDVNVLSMSAWTCIHGLVHCGQSDERLSRGGDLSELIAQIELVIDVARRPNVECLSGISRPGHDWESSHLGSQGSQPQIHTRSKP